MGDERLSESLNDRLRGLTATDGIGMLLFYYEGADGI